jgi:hypothetical protein
MVKRETVETGEGPETLFMRESTCSKGVDRV